MAAEIGVELLTPEQYHHLQTLGEFDQKHRVGLQRQMTSVSWEEPTLAIAAMDTCLSITMGLSRFTVSGDLGESCGCDYWPKKVPMRHFLFL